jgi:hypothetical protein
VPVSVPVLVLVLVSVTMLELHETRTLVLNTLP